MGKLITESRLCKTLSFKRFLSEALRALENQALSGGNFQRCYAGLTDLKLIKFI
jgi:hypothetical protein